jgi:hypothetical protein
VVAFDDAADQEIALERGDVDVAIFWPGELSTRMRNDARWGGAIMGIRGPDVLALVTAGALAADSLIGQPPEADLAKLNRSLFRGDLLRFDAERPRFSPGTVRYQVDPAIPAWRSMERILGSGPPTLPAVRVVHFPTGSDSIRWSGSFTSRESSPLFSIRCAVIATPETRNIVTAIGAGTLAELLHCSPALR